MTDVVEPEDPLPPNSTFMTHDVTSEADWNRVLDAIIADAGALDILVNNAGVFKTGDMEAETVEGWEFVMDINVKGVRPRHPHPRTPPGQAAPDPRTPLRQAAPDPHSSVPRRATGPAGFYWLCC